MTRVSLFRFALVAVLFVLVVGAPVAAQDDQTLVVSFWGNVDDYEQGSSDNAAWQATYDLINEWAEMKGVNVEFISQPIDGVYDRIRTQLISNTLPDLVAIYPANSYLTNNLDLIYNLTPHLAEPNPYGEMPTWGEELWYDTNVGLRDTAIPAGEVYFVGNSLPSNIGQLVIYYNIDAFEEAGIDGPPETFAELIEACDTLKANGWTPMYNDATGAQIGWYTLPVVEGLWASIADEITTAWNVPDGPFAVTQEMLAWAIQNGVLTGSDPRVQEAARVLNELEDRCWNEDWQAPDTTVDYFLTGQTAMTHNGFWALDLYRQSPDRDFEFGTFAFPLITEESSDAATLDVVRRWGGTEGGEIGNSFMIPATTEENGKVDLAVDLLQFLTARTTNDQWCEAQPMPCVPEDQPIEEVITDPVAQTELYGFYNPPMSNDTAIRGIGDPTPDGVFLRLFQTYSADGITLEEFGQQLDEEWQRWAERAIIDNGWDTSQWPAAPSA